ncbi:hypothetical protein [Nocardia sp. CA-290969]|uniref:hypothetical protein n=1 Tax=Nocardia sp. CA-290969 TaxID=3239986 RepID=UPI003D94F1FF
MRQIVASHTPDDRTLQVFRGLSWFFADRPRGFLVKRGTPEYEAYVKKIVDQAPPFSEAKRRYIQAWFAEARINQRAQGLLPGRAGETTRPKARRR